MIDISLIDCPVDVVEYTEVFPHDLPCLFLGLIIKNEYDNQRLKLNKEFNPQKRLLVFKKLKDFSSTEEKYEIMPLYGLFLPLNELGTSLCKTLRDQDNIKSINKGSYELILNEFNVTCNDSFLHLNKKIYPVDLKYFKTLTNYYADKEKEINILYGHLLCLEKEKFDFQQFGSFKLLILA